MQSDHDPHKKSLNVLPSSGKVDQWKREMAENPPASSASTDPAAFRTAIDPANAPMVDPNASIEVKLLHGKVVSAIRQVFDPEIPVNIYELGLIYSIDIKPDNTVDVRMTLTTPACPVAGSLPGEVQRRIESIEEVKGANIDLVWDPPWDRSVMSEAAMLQLGMF
jgi:FeS assembly SUF system protein